MGNPLDPPSAQLAATLGTATGWCNANAELVRAGGSGGESFGRFWIQGYPSECLVALSLQGDPDWTNPFRNYS